MSASLTASDRLQFRGLSTHHKTEFRIQPTPQDMRSLAEQLNLSDLRKLRFDGTLQTFGKRDWRLDAMLGATLVQPCAVTLDPVTTRIDVPVVRKYLANFDETHAPESEMPEDETVEALPADVSPWDVMVEALDLNVPLFPRSEGASLKDSQFTEPGKVAMTDEDAKPFAGLAALRDQIANDDSN